MVFEDGVDGRLSLAVKPLHSDKCVQVGGVQPQPFTAGVGRQGRVLTVPSPLLIICMNWIAVAAEYYVFSETQVSVRKK